MPVDLVYTTGSGKSVKTLSKYFNLPERSRLTDKEVDLLIRIQGYLKFQGIDEETAVGILQSFETKFGKPDGIEQRLSKFDNFLSVVGNRTDLIESVKNVGMLSNEELESQAKETGDWVSVIKQNQPSRGLADLAVDKKEKIG